jgi:hypothetical protein
MPRAQPEQQIQKAIVRFLEEGLPKDWIVVHTANKPRSRIAGAIEKSMGAKAGMPDLVIYGSMPTAYPYTTFFEVKSDKGRLSPEQAAMHAKLIKQGFLVFVVRSLEDAKRACIAAGFPPLKAKLQ